MTDTLAKARRGDEGAAEDPWATVGAALALLAVDPIGLGGVWIRARAGGARELLLEHAARLFTPWPARRLPARLDAERLFGGVDLATSLADGRPVRTPGLFEVGPAFWIAPMAERLEPAQGALLARALEAPPHPAALALLDEAAEPEEGPPAALTDRLAFFLNLEGLTHRRAEPALAALNVDRIAAARARLPAVELPEPVARELAAVAAAFGVESLRAALFAARAARAAAALAERGVATEADGRQAATLILAPRRKVEWSVEPEGPPPEPEAQTPGEGETPEERAERDASAADAESLVEAARAALPVGLLAELAATASQARAPQSGGSGRSVGRRAGGRRGRPLPARRGAADGRARIDLPATLRAAAPWSTLRRRALRAHPSAGLDRPILIRPEDIRLKRFAERRERAILFVVDASGSTALARLGEAKGAVELLLGEAYARRDHVGLIAFRGAGAETILPPTRALVAAKRRLAGLPSGGGTPLAAGLLEALRQTDAASRRGLRPGLVLLTDGRANLTLEGAPGRETAAREAREMALRIRATGAPSLVIDMATRPQASAAALADALGATYLPLPHADARRLSAAANTALD